MRYGGQYHSHSGDAASGLELGATQYSVLGQAAIGSHHVVTDSLQVLSQRRGDVAFEQRHRHPRARAQLDRVGEAHGAVARLRAVGKLLQPPHALVEAEVALDLRRALRGQG